MPSQKLTDESKMPFGAHKDKPMRKVPAQYLLWLWDNGVWEEEGRPIHEYIKESFSALEQDAKDYIVEHRP